METLCWNCSKGANECEFMRRLVPVPNWKAKKVMCEDSWTYHVIECPDFVLVQRTEPEKIHKPKSGVKIRCIETGKVYDSIKDCANDIHVSPSYISLSLVGHRKIRGLHFERVRVK